MAVGLALGLAARVSAGDFSLTAEERERVESREVVVVAALDSTQRRGVVRGAVLIDAQPATVFELLTSCAEAVQYVPHLRVCRVRERAPDNSWLVAEHEIDFGWYAPRVRYTFRADLTADQSIDFRQVSGDFKLNEGRWLLEPVAEGAHTLLLYHATIDPPGFVPNWLARSTYRRELPQMLTDLRKRCEAKDRSRAVTGASAR